MKFDFFNRRRRYASTASGEAVVAPLPTRTPVDVERVFFDMVADRPLRRVLEAGTLQSVPGRSTHWHHRFPSVAAADYLRLDIGEGPDVDVVGDLHALPAAWTDGFDVFVANAVFEHLERPWIAAREIHRVLAPGGLFFVCTHQTFPVHGYPSDFFRFSREALALIFRDAGFEIAAADYAGRCAIVPPPEIVPAAMLAGWNRDFESWILVAACGRKPV